MPQVGTCLSHWCYAYLVNQALLSTTMVCTCITYLCTYLSRPLQNNNVKCPSSALSAREREPQQLAFNIFILIYRRVPDSVL